MHREAKSPTNSAEHVIGWHLEAVVGKLRLGRAESETRIDAAGTQSLPVMFGTNGSFTVTTIGFPIAALTLTGTLPNGLQFTDNGNGTATLAGAPTVSGTFALTITAGNGLPLV